MLPHDEIYHYGVLGMKWGIRKDRYISKKSKKPKKNKNALKRKLSVVAAGVAIGLVFSGGLAFYKKFAPALAQVRMNKINRVRAQKTYVGARSKLNEIHRMHKEVDEILKKYGV